MAVRKGESFGARTERGPLPGAAARGLNRSVVELMRERLGDMPTASPYHPVIEDLLKSGLKVPQDLVELALNEGRGEQERAAAWIILRDLRIREALPAMLRAITTAPLSVAEAAAIALWALDSKAATRPLLGLLGRARPKERRLLAIKALEFLQDRRAWRGLTQLALDDSEDEEVRTEAVSALSGLITKAPGRVVPVLLRTLRDTSSLVRWRSATVLAASHDPRAIAALRSAVEDRAIPRRGLTSVGQEASDSLDCIETRLHRKGNLGTGGRQPDLTR